jgi:hypothetical protein
MLEQLLKRLAHFKGPFTKTEQLTVLPPIGVSVVLPCISMSESKSIRSRDPIWILQRALSHLMAHGKDFTNADYDAVFEIKRRAKGLLWDLRRRREETPQVRRAVTRGSL